MGRDIASTGKEHSKVYKRKRRTTCQTNTELLKVLQWAMDQNFIRGYAYGLILNDGSTVNGASHDLSAWWEDKVRFDKNAMAASYLFHGSDTGASHVYGIDPSLPLHKALLQISDSLIGAMVSVLMTMLNSLQPLHECKTASSEAPLWWPTGKDDWWPELADMTKSVPDYKLRHNLRKAHKVAVLVAMIRHMEPNYRAITDIVQQCFYMRKNTITPHEMVAWDAAITEERRRYLEKHPDDTDTVTPIVPTTKFIGQEEKLCCKCVLKEILIEDSMRQQREQFAESCRKDGDAVAVTAAYNTSSVMREANNANMLQQWQHSSDVGSSVAASAAADFVRPPSVAADTGKGIIEEMTCALQYFRKVNCTFKYPISQVQVLTEFGFLFFLIKLTPSSCKVSRIFFPT